jgi:hypothetical protein
MTLNFAVRFLAVCSLAAVATGQQSSPQYSVAGVVVNSQTGETVKRAQVVLMYFGGPELRAPRDRGGVVASPGGPQVFTTFSDSAGFFRFSVVPGGNCFISADKPGFTETPLAGRSLSLNLIASMEDVRLSLTPLGVITGKVVDQDGQPLRGVNIIALTQRMEDGTRQTQTARNVATDDRGMYRLWNLIPGKYYVKAAGKSGGTNLYAGETPPRYLVDEAFAPTYFGGGKTLDAAQPIQIEAGTEARADVNLTLQQAYKIRGALTNFVPRRTVKFELLSGDEDLSASRVSVNGDTGTFQILDVIPGSYTVRATQDATRAEVPVNVSGADLNGLSIQLWPGVQIHIHSQLTNLPKEPEKYSPFDRITGAAVCSVSLHPPGRGSGASYHAVPSSSAGLADGGGTELLLPGVLPGTYRAAIQCNGGYARSAMFGTQDLLVNPVLTIQPGAAPPAIEIVATHGGGTVDGTVSLENVKKVIALLLVPQFTPSTGPVTTSSGNPGKFQFAGLAPGPYTAYAFSSMEEIEFRNPVFIQSLTGGVSVQVEDNQGKSISITGLVR